MLDIRYIREHPDEVKDALRKKHMIAGLDQLLDMDRAHRKVLQQVESLRAEANALADEIGRAKAEKQENVFAQLLHQADDIKGKLRTLEPAELEQRKKLEEMFLSVPNIPLPDVPEGKDASENVVLREEGEKPHFSFPPKDYLTLAKELDLLDMERAGKVSGSRFGYLKNEAALLEFALVQFVFPRLHKEGFIPIVPPVLIRQDLASGIGYPNFYEGGDAFSVPNDALYLVGTSEHTLIPMHKDEILDASQLPLRYVAFSSCFRREAGSYGKDTKGILRVHQFDKVEMVSFTKPEQSLEEFSFLQRMEEAIVQELKIPYRVIKMCTGDLGFPSAAKQDLEAWLPGQNDGKGEYRETHSASLLTDFQARRLNIRFKSQGSEEGNRELRHVHTLNATAVAIGRMLIAIIENYQQEDGSVLVPEALRPYVGFEQITKK